MKVTFAQVYIGFSIPICTFDFTGTPAARDTLWSNVINRMKNTTGQTYSEPDVGMWLSAKIPTCGPRLFLDLIKLAMPIILKYSSHYFKLNVIGEIRLLNYIHVFQERPN